MEFKEIREIVELMDEHDLSLFQLEREGISLTLKKGADLEKVVMAQAPAAAPLAVAPAAPAAASPAPADAPAASNESEIASPMVGTFYRAASPEAGPYVNVGDEVTEDSVVCIIEAMKVMNEIKAEARGVVTKVLIDDGTPVQYGQPLFLIKPA